MFQKTIFNKLILITGLTAIMSTTLIGSASAGMAGEPMNKRIYIGSPAQRQPLKVDFTPTKPSFAVNEAIKFNIKGNKKFFLFLFNIDYATNKAYMILPNNIQTADRNMYQAGQRLQVPNANAEFYSDRPGRERIVMIATTKYPKEIVLNKYRRAGNFYITDAKTVQDQLKRIQVRGSQIRSNTTEEVFIKEFDLPIHAGEGTIITTQMVQPAMQPDVQSTPTDYSIRLIPTTASTSSVILPAAIPSIAFVSTDRVSYRSGEPLTISFGANQDGYVTLYTKNSGNYERLTETAVKANVMNTLKGRVGRKGKQEVMGVFSKTKGYKAKSDDLKSHSNAAQGKGFIIATNPVQQPTAQTISTQPVATAVANFWVY
ncbi:MAG TPA: DUF4384 domain-containing protein [Aeromonadales bacterium]|nr:DUF4384 domain-containing protein [Aeromonadales bacterium]